MVPKPLSLLLGLIKLLHVACGQGDLCRPSSACPIGGITLPSCLLPSLLVLLVNLMICRQDCHARALGLGLELLGRRLQASSSPPGFRHSPASFRLGTSLLSDGASQCDSPSAFVIVEILSARHFVFDSRKLNEFVFNYNRS